MEEKEYLNKCIDFLINTKPSDYPRLFMKYEYLGKFKMNFLPRLKKFINGEPEEKTDFEVGKEVFDIKSETVTSSSED